MAGNIPLDFDYILQKRAQGITALTTDSPIVFNPDNLELGIDDASTTNSGIVNTTDQSIAGVKTFIDTPQCSKTPATATDLVNRGYIDQFVNYNVAWQQPVLAFYNFIIPIDNASDGDRYICNATVPVSLIAGHNNHVVAWSSSTNEWIDQTQFTINHIVSWSASGQYWIDTTPHEGYSCHVDADAGQFANQNVFFNGTAWINIGSTTTYADLIGKPNQDLNTTSNVSFNSITTSTLNGSAGGMNILPTLRSNNVTENITVLDGAQTLSDIYGTYLFTGIGTVNLKLRDPTLTTVNGTTATIISHKQSGSVININSSNNYTYITGLPNNCTAYCQMTDRTQDPLHAWSNPHVSGGVPYYANVYTNNSSGTKIGSMFIQQIVNDYTVDLIFTWVAQATAISGATNMCVGPLKIPSLTGAYPTRQQCMITTTDLGIVPATISMGDSDLLYLYIKPTTGSYGASDTYFGIFTTRFTYIWRPNEY